MRMFLKGKALRFGGVNSCYRLVGGAFFGARYILTDSKYLRFESPHMDENNEMVF